MTVRVKTRAIDRERANKKKAYLLPLDIRAKNPTIRPLEQTILAHIHAQLRPIPLRLRRRLDDGRGIFLRLGDRIADEVDVGFDRGRNVGEGPVGPGDHEEVGEVGDRAA